MVGRSATHPFVIEGDVIIKGTDRASKSSFNASRVTIPPNTDRYQRYVNSLRVNDEITIIYPNGYHKKARISGLAYRVDNIQNVSSVFCLTLTSHTVRVTAEEFNLGVPRIGLTYD